LLNLEHYVELKGTDIPHAVEQVESTIHAISAGVSNVKKHCFIVVSHVRPRLNTVIQNAKVRFKRQYNSELIVKENICEHVI
jgi:hypothetical protein